jgi:protein-tyrosine phosphatase
LIISLFLLSSEYGISRSVAVVLAYLMWSEGRSFQLLYDELKEKKPEVRSAMASKLM